MGSPSPAAGGNVFDDLAAYNAQGHPIGGQAPFMNRQQRARMGRRADFVFRQQQRQQAQAGQQQARQQEFKEREEAREERYQQHNQARLAAARARIAQRQAQRRRRVYQEAGIETTSGVVGGFFKGLHNVQNSVMDMPTPGRIGVLLFAILVLLFFLVPVGVGVGGDKYGKTRGALAYDVVTGNAELPITPDTTESAAAVQAQHPAPQQTQNLAGATGGSNTGTSTQAPIPPPGTTQVGSAEIQTSVQPFVIPGMIVVPGTVETPW